MFRMCFNYLSVMTYETCSQKLLFNLRRDLYANMQAQDSSFFSKNRTGDLMTRLTGDLDMVRHLSLIHISVPGPECAPMTGPTKLI